MRTEKSTQEAKSNNINLHNSVTHWSKASVKSFAEQGRNSHRFHRSRAVVQVLNPVSDPDYQHIPPPAQPSDKGSSLTFNVRDARSLCELLLLKQLEDKKLAGSSSTIFTSGLGPIPSYPGQFQKMKTAGFAGWVMLIMVAVLVQSCCQKLPWNPACYYNLLCRQWHLHSAASKTSFESKPYLKCRIRRENSVSPSPAQVIQSNGFVCASIGSFCHP